MGGITATFHPQTQKLEKSCTALLTALWEGTAQKVSFEWSHLMISSTDSEVITV